MSESHAKGKSYVLILLQDDCRDDYERGIFSVGPCRGIFRQRSIWTFYSELSCSLMLLISNASLLHCIHELKGLIVFEYDDAVLGIELQARRRDQLNSTKLGCSCGSESMYNLNLNNPESRCWPATFSKTKSNQETFRFVF